MDVFYNGVRNKSKALTQNIKLYLEVSVWQSKQSPNPGINVIRKEKVKNKNVIYFLWLSQILHVSHPGPSASRIWVKSQWQWPFTTWLLHPMTECSLSTNQWFCLVKRLSSYQYIVKRGRSCSSVRMLDFCPCLIVPTVLISECFCVLIGATLSVAPHQRPSMF